MAPTDTQLVAKALLEYATNSRLSDETSEILFKMTHDEDEEVENKEIEKEDEETEKEEVKSKTVTRKPPT